MTELQKPWLGSKIVFDVSWSAAESRLLETAERGHGESRGDAAELVLETLGLVRISESCVELTELGESYYRARFVVQSEGEIRDVLSEMLRAQTTANTFCGTLWGQGNVQVSGAISLLRRITGSTSDASAKRWLALMNRADLIDYNRNKPVLRVKYNADSIVPPDEQPVRTRERSYAIAPDRPFGNLLALKDLLRSASVSIRWYEQHLPPKVLEILYREVDGANVSEIRLLSGPANLTADVKKDFKRFADEMLAKRGIAAEWRVLGSGEARRIHDRFFITAGQSRNLPPLNTILAGHTGEILDSDVVAEAFDAWWDTGQAIAAWDPRG